HRALHPFPTRRSSDLLAPAAGALLAAVADDGVPQAIGFRLVLRLHLERERLAVAERWASVEADARDPQHGELDRQHIALPAGRRSEEHTSELQSRENL